MNSLIALFRRAPRWGIAFPGMLLLLGLVIGGAHFHERGPEHSCAVCTMSHAPATTTVAAAPLAAPTTCVERVVVRFVDARAIHVALEHFGRAPPLS
jgi:hypothetical protein